MNASYVRKIEVYLGKKISCLPDPSLATIVKLPKLETYSFLIVTELRKILPDGPNAIKIIG